MEKKYFVYYGKYSGTYRIASAEDKEAVSALLAEGWTLTTLSKVRSLRKIEHSSVVAKISTAYIDAGGALVIVDPD